MKRQNVLKKGFERDLKKINNKHQFLLKQGVLGKIAAAIFIKMSYGATKMKYRRLGLKNKDL